jgi:hypothetical protein
MCDREKKELVDQAEVVEMGEGWNRPYRPASTSTVIPGFSP